MEIGRSHRISEWADFFPPLAIKRGLNLMGGGDKVSRRRSEDEGNNIVYGRLYRCAERWRERPVIILLDGSPAFGYHTVLPWIARRFNRAGFNAALLVAPYQLQRRPHATH